MSHRLKSASAIAAMLLLAACQQNDRVDGGDTAPGPDRDDVTAASPLETPPDMARDGGTRGPLLTVAGDGTGPGYLTDSAGQALYVLEGNVGGRNCDAACEEVWPPVLAGDTEPTVDPRLGSGGSGTLPRNDNGRHVTWEGQPLYRYAADAGAGRTAGDGVQDQWGLWALVRVDGGPAGSNQ